MKIRSFPAIMIFLLLCAQAYPQDMDRKILMTIAGRDVEAGEFIRMYNKSLDPDSSFDLNEYIEQFIAFKLKVADAIASGYDTARAFSSELDGYRAQLAQSYLTDPDIKEDLLKKAWERSLTEINASHILILTGQGPEREDSLVAYGKAMAARERLLRGESFESVAKETSDDRSVVINKGNLGYFTVFQMISQFEDAAYALTPGTISMPVRTRYGYHIIRVNDRRPAKGKVKVAHIMKTVPPGSDETAGEKAFGEINDIYEKLCKGESFSTLAKEYSDDRESAQNGGEMNWFGAGEIISEFTEAAFSLNDTGSFSEPVRTPYGFHIIRLLAKRPHGTYEETKPWLESKLNPSYLIAAGKKSFVSKLKKEYGYRVNTSALTWFVRNTDSLIIMGISDYNRRKIPQGSIYSFAGYKKPVSEFASFLEKHGSAAKAGDPAGYVGTCLEEISAGDLIAYENELLETKYPDFRYLMNEFHDGILLFNISSEKIWNKAQDDTTGLRNYYELNKNNYLLPFTEVQGELIGDYQEWLTSDWIRQLKGKYPVTIEYEVLEEVKQRLGNE
ncbi:MAG: peptidylprolyl isomerase [Bacteroidales bacterium]|jgi:peptidyl-prolyl cis-trans isomerase SurA|nr:peptidylprolyl isomerase [Bacteroidales bacterium]